MYQLSTEAVVGGKGQNIKSFIMVIVIKNVKQRLQLRGFRLRFTDHSL